MSSRLIGRAIGVGAQGGGGAPLSGPFHLLFISRVFSYLPYSRKVMRNPFVSM
jgi:hypothetical protein